jgi:hypothetical protein
VLQLWLEFAGVCYGWAAMSKLSPIRFLGCVLLVLASVKCVVVDGYGGFQRGVYHPLS